MTEEMVRDLEQIKHTIETVQKDLPRNQIQSETQTSSVKIVTPIYKLQEKTPGSEIQMGGSHAHSERISAQNGDYKAERSSEQFRMQIIDPRVNSNAHIPSQTGSLPHYGRRTVGDFPSEHGKRSLLNLDPLEQRRIRSIQSRPVTTSTYLTESVDRHREMEASKLRQFLKASEDDANKPWNKPAWPGPKGNDDTGESMRELELIRKKIDNLQKRGMQRTQSMGEFMLEPLKEENTNEVNKIPDSGWLVKVRTHQYLQNAKNSFPSKTRSVGDLRSQDPYSWGRPSRFVDELSWQLKKEFHLSKYVLLGQSDVIIVAMSFDQEQGRRRVSSVQQLKNAYLEQVRRDAQRHAHHKSVPVIGVAGGSRTYAGTPLGHITPSLPDIQEAPHEGSSASSVTTQASLLLYPPGSTDQVLSENTPAPRPSERIVYENKPIAPSVLAVNVSQASTSHLTKSSSQSRYPPARQPEDDFSERLMSPPPGRQTPKSILKQGFLQQHIYSDQDQSWEERSQIYRQEGTEMRDSSYLHNHEQGEPSNRGSNRTPAHYGSNYELDDAERFRIMQENLRKHRENRSYTPQNVPKYPTTSFNGPFFKLEEVTPGRPSADRPRSQSVAPMSSSEQRRYEEEMRYHYDESRYHEASRVKQISSSEMELHRHSETPMNEGVVIWPPPSIKDRPRPASAMARSILDPDKINEFRKQKQLELESIRRREDRENYLRQKQIHAMQLQQQRLYEQRQMLISEQPELQSQPYHHPPQNIPEIHAISPTEDLIDKSREEPTETSQPVRVFETRPISVLSGESPPDPHDVVSPGTMNTWRRTYLVDKAPEATAKNEILTSDDILGRERFEVDLLKRREAFIEKPEDEPEIFRTGKRWQPPPEKPYIWPTLRRPVTVEPGMIEHPDFSPGVPEGAEYRWQPIVYEPGFKKEHKNFTPTNSPPHSPRRGLGTGPLDDVARRQTKYVIQPSPDGSHRPKPAFKATRQTPSGGFLPHAPNSVKVIKKRSSQIHNSLSPDMVDQEIQDIEIIHERNLQDRRSQGQARSRSLNTLSHSKGPINDWEKIYDLPPHASTITNKDPPPNVDVRKRLQLFESQAATLQRRAYSEQRGSNSQLHSISATPRLQQSDSAGRAYASQTPNGGTLLRRVDSRGESHQHRHKHRSERSIGGERQIPRRSSRSETPTQHHVHYPQSSTSSLPPGSRPEDRPASATSQRRLQRIMQAIQPSPAPPSYERARPYLPPPLPPGYKRPPSPQYGHQQISPRSPPPQQPGNTRRLVQIVQHAAQSASHALQRHDSHRAQPVQSGIHPAEYAPAAQEPKKEQIREMLESRISTDTGSFIQHDRSGYVTDASSATWQFNNSFSPKSIVSLNGAKVDEGLLKVRTTVAASEHDDKPRSIMKRSQLESREQMTYAEPERRVVEVVRAKPKVTETVSRVEEQKRTEEVERRIIRRERRHKSSRHRYGHGHGHHAEYVDWGSGGGEDREAIVAEARRAAAEAKLLAAEKREKERTIHVTSERTLKHQTLEEEESRRSASQQRSYQQEVERYSKAAQTSQDQQGERRGRRQVVLRRYDGRRYTADELNQAVKNAYTAVDRAYRDLRQWRSNSMQRHNGYLPAHESYHRSTSSRRDRDFGGEFGNRYIDNRGGLAHARYGSLSDSLRKGELKYVPNGDFRENYNKSGKMHKSYSTRDVYHDGAREGSWHRGSASGYAPLVEFPPTLPRSARGDAPTLPPHRGFPESQYRPLVKSRSYADWDEGRGPFGSSVKRYEDDMARLENEFRDSLLMRLPNGNMNEKDYRQEQIPGGHETHSRETKSNAGRRLNRDGVPTDFKEASQEYSFKREVQH
ncbi:hypothetical protein FO519_003382 [Halicephalobus sp. NKZ332]|nr:hypothetical protein FO519_003382 [Halicephalobus sp. NKZ332]